MKYEFKIEKTPSPKPKPDPDTLKFGKTFTDHMFVMQYETGKGWHDGRIVPYGPLSLDPSSGKAYINGIDMVLSQKEYSLLQQFVQHPDRIFDAEHLYEKVWGQKNMEDDTSLKVAISKLRGKLTDSGYTITASRGEGYYLEQC